jgi:hypothetical protein
LANRKVLEEITIALLNASVCDPGFLLYMFLGAKLIKARLTLVSTWMVNLNGSVRLSFDLESLSCALLIGVKVFDDLWLSLMVISFLILEINGNFVWLNLLSILLNHPRIVHQNLFHCEAAALELIFVAMDFHNLASRYNWMEKSKLNLE